MDERAVPCNFYPEGEHELVRPQQKYLRTKRRGLVLLWLKEKDSDPAKAEQYKPLARTENFAMAERDESGSPVQHAALASLRKISHATGL